MTPVPRLPITRERALWRAVESRGLGTYGLGRGHGNDPRAKSVLGPLGLIDCSNAVHYWIGSVLDQSPWGGLYLNTDGLVRDAFGILIGDSAEAPRREPPRRTSVRPLEDGEPVLPCDLVVRRGVYEWVTRRWVRTAPGHVELVSQVLPGYDRERHIETADKLLAIGAALRGGDPPSIRETDCWDLRYAYLMRYLHFVGE